MTITDVAIGQALAQYKLWLEQPDLDPVLADELHSIEGKMQEIVDRFYRGLEFGTGGLRGVLGAGTNRLNVYTIRKAAQGLARVVQKAGAEACRRGIVIAHDSRRMSPEFTIEAARVLATAGIKAYIFDGLRPTPLLSYAVRQLGAFGGIVITASHNPPEYNGFKVYGEDGGQIPPTVADAMLEEMEAVTDLFAIQPWSKEKAMDAGLIQVLDDDMDADYIAELKGLLLHEQELKQWGGALRIVYSPLHGTGYLPVKRVLEESGFTALSIVNEQAAPDSEFSTVESPNPEEPEAFTLAMDLGEQIDAHLLMATDPDADRMGMAVRDHEGSFRVLTGNQAGALMLDYILSQRQEKGILPEHGVVLKTIVTSELGRSIASRYGLDTVDTLTGFKYIGEKIAQYEQTGEKEFLFGYEESYGYLMGSFVRDKDAVQACLIAAEMAAYHQAQGRSLWDRLNDIYEEHGHYRESLKSITLKGIEGAQKISGMLTSFRENPLHEVAGTAVGLIEDYQKRIQKNITTGSENPLTLPPSNVIKYTLNDASWFCLRPSGTEPKLKIYFSVRGATARSAQDKLYALEQAVMTLIEHRL